MKSTIFWYFSLFSVLLNSSYSMILFLSEAVNCLNKAIEIYTDMVSTFFYWSCWTCYLKLWSWWSNHCNCLKIHVLKDEVFVLWFILMLFNSQPLLGYREELYDKAFFWNSRTILPNMIKACWLEVHDKNFGECILV